MKILLVTESYWPNPDGGAQFTRRLVQDLCADGHNVNVWAPGRKLLSFTEKDGKSTIFREKSIPFIIHWQSRMSYWPFWRTTKIFAQTQPDVVHIHFPTLMGLLSIRAARKRDIPVMATNHFMPENLLFNLHLKPHQWLYKQLEKICWVYVRWYYRKVDYLTSPTPTAVKLLRNHHVREPIEAISNGVDVSSLHKATADKALKHYKLPTNKPIVLYFGRVDKEKEIDIIVKAAAKVLPKLDIHLVIAGRGNDVQNLERLAQKLGISKHCTFTGYVSDELKASLFHSCDVFVISSPSELQSIVTLEAMSCGKAVIVANSTALPELVEPGKNGYLFKLGDAADLANKVQQIVSDPKKVKAFGQASYDKVMANHSAQATLKAFERVYTKLTKP